MKLQIDTTVKTIKIEENIKFSKLIETLKKLFPNNEWKDFTLETNTTINHWSNPIVIREYPRPYEYPWYSGQHTYGIREATITNDLKPTMQLCAGSFNVQI